jgi:hypothetical protein
MKTKKPSLDGFFDSITKVVFCWYQALRLCQAA